VEARTRLLEAALYAADRPLALEELARLDPEADLAEWGEALEELRRHYETEGHGVELRELAGGYQVLTQPALADALARAAIAPRPTRLSMAALEVLAIIAYRQPVTRAEIEDIRGVACDGVLRLLQERGLLDVVGRSEGLGRPLLYGTTPRFLEHMGLGDLRDLPKSEDLTVVLRPPSTAL
jgi:segregation and condensation protein B